MKFSTWSRQFIPMRGARNSAPIGPRLGEPQRLRHPRNHSNLRMTTRPKFLPGFPLPFLHFAFLIHRPPTPPEIFRQIPTDCDSTDHFDRLPPMQAGINRQIPSCILQSGPASAPRLFKWPLRLSEFNRYNAVQSEPTRQYLPPSGLRCPNLGVRTP